MKGFVRLFYNLFRLKCYDLRYLFFYSKQSTVRVSDFIYPPSQSRIVDLFSSCSASHLFRQIKTKHEKVTKKFAGKSSKMFLTRSEYDRSVNTFSPEGRLFQVRASYLIENLRPCLSFGN